MTPPLRNDFYKTSDRENHLWFYLPAPIAVSTASERFGDESDGSQRDGWVAYKANPSIHWKFDNPLLPNKAKQAGTSGDYFEDLVEKKRQER